MAARKAQPKVEIVEPVTIVDKRSGTICTVGSNIVDKYITGSRAKYREYDESIDGQDPDVYDDDEPIEGEDSPVDPKAPAKK
jgi:hypothetical protein